jgi:nitrite reductase/ring-hydroxylating ferredoxin subunit
MKSGATDNDATAHQRIWSTELDRIPPGRSEKFHIFWRKRLVQGFVVNFRGQFYAYVNHCAHAGTPLDWWPNEFFTDDQRLLKCGTHGSLYDPASGTCAGGPCAGGRLFRLSVRIDNGRLIVTGSNDS